MGIFYIVSTPIGNMEDITLRALRILGEVDMIACEDTRKTGMLLKHHGIINKPNLISLYEENEEIRTPQIISALKEGKNVALVSNAGTPLLSDPGFRLARQAIHEGVKVESIPGPSALLSALVSSCLPMDKFLFLGFLPKKPIRQQKIFDQIKNHDQMTIIFYESPYRLKKTLDLLKQNIGNVEISIGRELTKLHEEIFRGTIEQAIDHFSGQIKGEITIVLLWQKA